MVDVLRPVQFEDGYLLFKSSAEKTMVELSYHQSWLYDEVAGSSSAFSCNLPMQFLGKLGCWEITRSERGIHVQITHRETEDIVFVLSAKETKPPLKAVP